MIFKNKENNKELLLHHCAEATLNYWSFKDQLLSVNLTTYDDDELIINIKTDTVYSTISSNNKNINVCRLEIQDIHELLSTHNGYYIPPDNFSDLMRFSRMNISPFYGKKYDIQYNLSFKNSENLLSCPIESLEYSVLWWIQ